MRTQLRKMLTLLTIAFACTRRSEDAGIADTATVASPAHRTDATRTDQPATGQTAEWTVTPDGIGPIAVGMGIADLRRVAGDLTLPTGADTVCAFVRPRRAPPGVSVMLVAGRVARIDIDSAGVQTSAGAGIGDPESRITNLYAGRVTVTPHKYVEGGRYLTVSAEAPANAAHRIVFETQHGRITRFRAGRLPEVSWVERCG